ncbi:MAG: OmpA family protein [Bacteroidota bacterium]
MRRSLHRTEMCLTPAIKHSFLIGLITIGFFKVRGQNLIKNPSFESYINCPEYLGNLNTDVISWSVPTEGSTDYFHGCSTAMGTPKNFNGTQPADFGKGYAGLYFYAPKDYREYLQAELKETLVAGQKYKLSFYVSLAERSDFAVKEFGVLFSGNKLSFATKKELSKGLLYKKGDNTYHRLEIGYSNFYLDTLDWILVHTEFIAKGTERFMTLGNFKKNKRTRLIKTRRNARQGAYYYIDMVMLGAAGKAPDPKEFFTDREKGVEGFTLDTIHVFENVLFEFDKFQLLETARTELHAIYAYLRDNESLRIAIKGHTDNVGSLAYNQRLSGLRAKSVAQYLMDMGIPPDRISWQGLAGQVPIADNSTETGRMQNRRVEFVIARNDP